MSEFDPTAAVDSDVVRATRERAASAERIVIKAGTNSLTDADSNLDDEKVDKLVDDISDLLERGREVLLVSSGAIGAGHGRVEAPTDTVEAAQALSTVGQSHLMRRYTESFERYDRTVAQVLLTQADVDDPERFTNFRNTVETLFEWGVVPIVNENDAIAIEEIQIGDNDMLSAAVAMGVDADLLVTLTDVDGVYTGHPDRDPTARKIPAVGENYAEVQELVEDSATDGFGGIITKVEGARRVNEHGIPAIVAGSAEADVLDRIAESESVGTIFVPVEDP